MASAFEAEQLRDTSITWTTLGVGDHMIELRGDLDPDDAGRYRRLGRLAIDEGHSITIDLAEVGIFGSWAVESLEDLRDHAARHGVRFEVINRPPHVDRVLDAVGFRHDSRFGQVREPGDAGHFFERADYEAIVAQTVLRSSDAVVITDTELDPPGPKIVFVNRAFTDLTGYAADEVLGDTPRVLQGELTDRAVIDRLRASLEEGRNFYGETINYRADGTPFVMAWKIVRLHGEDPGAEFYAALQSDVTEPRRLTRFETALTYLDSQLARVENDRSIDDETRRRRMVESMLDAHVSLMEGGAATASLVTRSGDNLFESTATDPDAIEAAEALIRSAEERTGADAHEPVLVDKSASESALLLPVTPHRRSDFESGTVVVHGMPRDRLQLADPHLHAQLATHGLCRPV